MIPNFKGFDNKYDSQETLMTLGKHSVIQEYPKASTTMAARNIEWIENSESWQTTKGY